MSMNWIGLYTIVRKELGRVRRVLIQALVAPWISALLFIFTFGFILGRKIDLLAGIPYIQFVFPGVLMMNVLTAAFMHSSTSLYFARFARTIEEMLVAPLSYLEMVLGFVFGAIVRTVITAFGIVAIGTLFGAVSFVRFDLFVFYLLSITIVFSLVGILIGLWSKGFEQLNVLNTFIIMPLSFIGGMFYPVTLLPEAIQPIAFWNPFFYFIDGMRFAMTGYHESNLWLGAGIIIALMAALTALTWYLFSRGWRIRE